MILRAGIMLFWGFVFSLSGKSILATPVVLSIMVPVGDTELYNDDFFTAFEEAHPGVEVVLKFDQAWIYGTIPYPWETEAHIAAVQNYVSQADVLYVDNMTPSPETTRAGYWLNLAPLISADPELSSDRFLPAVWRSFEWDNGFWAVPYTFNLNGLAYNKNVFDAAGLPYPTASWQVEDFARVTIELTQRDANNEVISIGFLPNFEVMRSLLGRNYWTVVEGRTVPQLDDPNLAHIISVWGDAWFNNLPETTPYENIPLVTAQILFLEQYQSQDGQPLTIAPLPGNVARVNVNGFAVSSGTLSPELAYELAKYTAQKSGIIRAEFFNVSPAWDVTGLDELGLNLSPTDMATLRTLFPNLIGNQELLYRNYVERALWIAWQEGIPADEALQRMQVLADQTAIQALALAEPVNLVTSVPPVRSDSGANLYFGISSAQIPNQQLWERIAAEFASTDSEISQVVVNPQSNEIDGYEAFMAQNDCYYLTYTAVDDVRIEDYLPLSPLLDVDPAFRSENFVPGTLEALQLNGSTWGYPFSLEITGLEVSLYAFEMAEIAPPDSNWSVDEFAATLAELKSAQNQTGMVPLALRPNGNNDILALIAAYGGLPIDYQNQPPAINFTDPQNMEAIRQVLDLARNDLIAYQALGGFTFGFPASSAAIRAQSLQFSPQANENFAYVNYPEGARYQVFSLANIGGLYINRNTQYPDACYRWISTVAQHPELLPGVMPASLTALDNPDLVIAQGQAKVDFYKSMAAIAANPGTVVFYDNYSLASWLVTVWLGRAFDSYVLEGADLEFALADAQSKADEFLTCLKTSSVDGSENSELECLAKVDSDLYTDYTQAASSS